MAVEVKVPPLGESVSEATVAKWFKQKGDYVEADEMLVELETDKVTLEVNAPSAGILSELLVAENDNVQVGTVIGRIDTSAKKPEGTSAPEPKKEAVSQAPAPVSAPQSQTAAGIYSPAAEKLAKENNIALSSGSGKDGRITKGDMLSALEGGYTTAAQQGPREERVKMSKLRQMIAKRLKESQNTAAMLTTYNEVDMSALMELRNRYKDAFEKKHGTKLGFMSFFIKAAVTALQEIPEVNAQIDGDEIVYKNFYDIGVAVGSPNGLVVPVVRDCDKLSFAGVEQSIVDYAKKARDGKLGPKDMSGGTFTISNGGVFGSLLSSPIINPPQTAILGMHKTQDRPVAINGKVEIRPMMYLALSYDHRLIDGKEAVTFLVRIKECIEDPQRILLDM
jgi:2-oxoglutarate dehydrogenase E2 component (dihydrolipoamide succinyltransferase)